MDRCFTLSRYLVGIIIWNEDFKAVVEELDDIARCVDLGDIIDVEKGTFRM